MSASKNGGNSSNSLGTVPISSIMTKDVKIAYEDQSLYEICKIMHDNNIGSVVITKREREAADTGESKAAIEPVGIITERDIVNKIALKLDPASYRSSVLELFANKIMSTPLTTIFPNNTIKDAMQTMLGKNIRRLVVIEFSGRTNKESEENSHKTSRLIGIVTDKDIFKAIFNNQNFMTEILTDQSFISHKDLLERLGENLFRESWRKW
ncbi:MAG: CBS domain-containing protein [Nitrososphaeraceae archaeon]